VIATGLGNREHFQLVPVVAKAHPIVNCSSLSLDAVMGGILITTLTVPPVENGGVIPHADNVNPLKERGKGASAFWNERIVALL